MWIQLTDATKPAERISTALGVQRGDAWLESFAHGIRQRGRKAIVRVADKGFAVFVEIQKGELNETKHFRQRKFSAAEIAVNAEMEERTDA